MNDFLVYLDLPAVPTNLIEPIDVILNKPSKMDSKVPANFKPFQTRLVSIELADWIQNLFQTECYIQYQIVSKGIPIHKDIGRQVAFNYLLQPGGDRVLTTIHAEDKKLLAYEQIPAFKWHRLKTDEYHCVTGLTTERVAISVDIKDYIWNDDLQILSQV